MPPELIQFQLDLFGLFAEKFSQLCYPCSIPGCFVVVSFWPHVVIVILLEPPNYLHSEYLSYLVTLLLWYHVYSISPEGNIWPVNLLVSKGMVKFIYEQRTYFKFGYQLLLNFQLQQANRS